MNFTYGSYSVFSKIEAGRPFITVGLDPYLMDIEVVFTPHNPQQGALVIDDLRLGVSFADKEVGVARPSANSDSFIALRQLKTGQQQEVRQQFGLYLSPPALEALEASRNGSDAIFHLRVFGNITGYAAYNEEVLAAKRAQFSMARAIKPILSSKPPR